MTPWSTPALLLLGIAAGPYGLNLLSLPVVLLLDPGIAMAVAMLGVFVGLTFEPGRPRLARSIAASGLRTVTTVAAVSAAVVVASSYSLSPASLGWLPALLIGVCAAVSDTAVDINIDDILMIVAGSVMVGALRETSTGPLLLLALAFPVICITVALAGWLLVGQTNSEGEQHVFVVGSLLLLGGAATYLSLSAALAGLLAGLIWNLAGNLAKARIVRDLHYFQHPLVVLALVVAGAGATLSLDAAALAAIFVAVRVLARRAGAWIAWRLVAVRPAGDAESSLVSAGLVGLALALDAFRVDGRPEWAATLLGAVVIGTIASAAMTLVTPIRLEPR
jgi:hypothetical protein